MDKKYCIICGCELQGNQKMYCSAKCKQKAHYNKHKEDNPNSTYSQTIRGYRRKLKLIELKGGKCERCGYNKNISALDFHHLDASNKEFSLDLRKLSNTNWEKILSEANKCILLCTNCHKELHYPDATIENIKSLCEENLDKEEITHHKECPICGKQIIKSDHKIYCSDECRNKAFNKRFDKYPSFDEISKKYEELKSWDKVAKFFNVTRKIITGIRKRNQ